MRALPWLLLVGLAGCCAPPASDLIPDAPLPNVVQLKTRTESFGRQHAVAVRNGRLWIRPLSGEGGWALTPPDGLPREGCFFGFEPPLAVASVSADGDNLVAATAAGRVFYAKFSSSENGGKLNWTDEFGLLWRDKVALPEGQRGFAISHRASDVGHYADIDGNQHPVSFGVSTLYALDASGQVIRYADPWLEPKWSHLFYTPLRGRFVAISLSASASTLFVIDASGEMWTRLADYDTSGENPLPGWYSYQREFRDGRNVRTLPGWDWVQQPRPPGAVTAEITILQTGKGNAARELRVRGRTPQGTAGYWTKPIEAGAWSFVPLPELAVDDANLLRPLSDEARLGPVLDVEYSGTVGIRNRFLIRVFEFNAHNSPAKLVAVLGEDRFTALLHMRRVRPEKDGTLSTNLGTLEILPETLSSTAPRVRKLVQDVSKGERLVEVEVHVSPDGKVLELTEDTWLFTKARTITLHRQP